MMEAATLTQQLVSTLRRYEAAWLAYKLDDPMRAQLRTEARQLRQRAHADGGLALVQWVGEQAVAAGIFVLTIDDVWGLDWRPPVRWLRCGRHQRRNNAVCGP